MALSNLNPNSLTLSLLSFLILLATSFAQLAFDEPPTSATSHSPFTPPAPTGYGSTSPNSSSDGNDGNGDDGDDGDDSGNGVSNYYFLLIAVFAVICIISAWAFIRRRRLVARHMAEYGSGRYRGGYPRGPPGRRVGNMRWRMLGHEPRMEEGLNEQGEAPPPYMPGQAPPQLHTDGAHGVEGNDIALQTFMGKPPDYHASSSEEDLDMARPVPPHTQERDDLNDLSRRRLFAPTDGSSISHASAAMSGLDLASTGALTKPQEASHENASKEMSSSITSTKNTPSEDSDTSATPTTTTTTTISALEEPSGPATNATKETTHG